MTTAAIQREDVVGKYIAQVFQTSWSESRQATGAYASEGGRGEPHHCEIILELDSGRRFRVGDSELTPGETVGDLIEAQVFGDPGLSYLDEQIAHVVVDQYDAIYVVLANGVYLQNLVLEAAGNCFWAGSFAELRDEEDEEEPLVLHDYWDCQPVQLW